ncbi:matrilin-2-like isoform X1 [Paramuricea clavata]|uniref:Matrilin-2-like isoform X1 n=1 Tax=Paramuricea clavata TaxID=317549 RepID=A0A6S7HAZ6_PARCT|nr:matrilin-2-like isoform X1 [Paramuricea clavata]
MEVHKAFENPFKIHLLHFLLQLLEENILIFLDDPCAKNVCDHSCEVVRNRNGTSTGKCRCRSGYYLRTDGKTCVDDPCAKNVCDHSCEVIRNRNGTSTGKCRCRSGYYLRTDGKTCVG